MRQSFGQCDEPVSIRSGGDWSWSASVVRQALSDVVQRSAKPWKAGVVFRCVRWLFRRLVFGFLQLDVRGLAQIPREGGLIIAGNHPSVLDGILLFAVSPRPVRFLVAEDLYTHRYLHPFFTLFGCIPVYRTIPPPATGPLGRVRRGRTLPTAHMAGGGTKTHNGDALRAAVAALEAGEVIGIFPEGTIHDRGAMQQVKRGVALLALKTGCPVVPLAVRGSAEAFPDGARVPRPCAVSMRFETPIAYPKAALDPIPEEDVLRALEQIRRSILAALQMTSIRAPGRARPAWIKPLRVALCSVVVLPLTSFLTLTANPSLDPVRKARL